MFYQKRGQESEMDASIRIIVCISDQLLQSVGILTNKYILYDELCEFVGHTPSKQAMNYG
jgi:hypothetical protein